MRFTASGVIAVVAVGLLAVSMFTGGRKSDRLNEAEAHLAAVADTVDALRDTADAALAYAERVDEEARQDSVERVVVVREVEREIEVDLAAAAATEDTIRQVLEQVHPAAIPVFNRLMARQKLALGRTQFLLDDERLAHDRTRGRVLHWQTATFTARIHAQTAERAQAAAERALALAKQRDISFAVPLLGRVELDVTCGPGAGFSIGTKGPDAAAHIGCVIGR